ncbi:MAG: TonB-dependent receptor [Gammaproteobacteria bacterium]|nr:TonB-dependent receptor [Gammaproteobacteria bacterium]
MKMNWHKLLVLCIAVLLGQTVWGQARVIEEMVVTATHRAVNVQDIPISVTALGAEELENKDISDAASISQNVPGMSYGEFAPGQALISLRGVTSADDGAGLDNSVGLFLDGVYIGRGAGINFEMFDLERIEVLRGPQGTLFGRNAIGGAISAVTAKPSEETQIKLGATAGNEGILRYKGLVSGQIAEQLYGKISFTHREHDGFVKNVLLNTELQDEDQTSIRAQLRWQGDAAEWILSVDTMEDDRADMGRTGIVDRAPLTAIMAANGVNGAREQASPSDGFSERDSFGISLQGNIDFGSGTFTSITATRKVETDWEMASVGAGLGALGLPFDEVIDDIVEDIDTFSQEFRWTSDLDGNFDYVVGLFYLVEDTDRVEQFKITAAGTYGDPTSPFRVTDVGSQNIIGNEYAETNNETTSWAVYAHADWELSEQWNVSLGGRYTRDKKDYGATSVDCGNDLTGTAFENFVPCAGLGGSLSIISESFSITANDEWTDFSPKASIQFFANDDVMFFATISKGFKSGGFAGSQGVETSASIPVDPQEATNFELGMKGTFFDSRLRFNLTGFRTDYDDLQIVRFGPVAGSAFGTFVTANIGEAEMTGFEAEWEWWMTDNLSLSGYYAYLDTEVNDLVLETTGGPVDASGSPLRQAPENSTNLVLAYELATQMGTFDFSVTYHNTDEQLMDYVFQATKIDRTELFDANVTWRSSDEKWKLSLWGKNLKDDEYIAHAYVIGPGVIGVWGPPRTMGLTATYSM